MNPQNRDTFKSNQEGANSGIKKLLDNKPGNSNIIIMNKKSLFKIVDELLMKRLDQIFESQNAFPGHISSMLAEKMQKGGHP